MKITTGNTYRFINLAHKDDPRWGTRARVVTRPQTGGLLYVIEFESDGKRAAASPAMLHAIRPSNTAIDMMIDGWDAGDPWGSAMCMLHACCTVLQATGDAEKIDPGAGWVPAPGSLGWTTEDLADPANGHDYETSWLAECVDDGTATITDIAKATRILSLYADLVRAAGKDY